MQNRPSDNIGRAVCGFSLTVAKRQCYRTAFKLGVIEHLILILQLTFQYLQHLSSHRHHLSPNQ